VRKTMVVCAVVACAWGWSLPAAADMAPEGPNPQYLGLKGPTLNDADMSEMRGGYLPGASATIIVDGVTTTDYDPATPGSASVEVSLGPNTVSRARASTSGTGGSARATVTITNLTTSTSIGNPALNAALSNPALRDAGSSLRMRGGRR